MCTCITELSAPALYTHPKGKLITRVEVPTALRWEQSRNRLSAVTVSILQITVEGKEAKEKFTLDHSYCPFCGVKYGQDEPAKPALETHITS